MGNGKKFGCISPVLSANIIPNTTTYTDDILIWHSSLVQKATGLEITLCVRNSPFSFIHPHILLTKVLGHHFFSYYEYVL